MNFNDKEEIIALTPLWKGDRMDDGRPYVPDKYLKALRSLTLEEIWKPIFVKGYESQFEGRLHTLHNDGRKLIGRAVTAEFCPYRPDLDGVMKGIGTCENRHGTYNQWVIDSLGTRELNPICLFIVKFPLFRLVSLARRQPCCAFTHQKSKNFPNIEVGEFKKRKFFCKTRKKRRQSFVD